MSGCPAPGVYGPGESCGATTVPYTPPSMPGLAESGADPLPLLILAGALVLVAIAALVAAHLKRTGRNTP